MYYSAQQPPTSIHDKATNSRVAPLSPRPSSPPRRLWWIGISSLVLLICGGAIWVLSGYAGNRPETLGEKASIPQSAGRVKTFSSLLQSAPMNYEGWLAVVQEGSISLIDPQSRQQLRVFTASDQWHGPISDVYWSPDRSKLAFLTIPSAIADQLAANPNAGGTYGLDSSVNPRAFPFGHLTVVHLADIKVDNSGAEVKNTAQSLSWMDNQRIAYLNQSLMVYDLASATSTLQSAGGGTSNHDQLQSPLLWDSEGHRWIFSKIIPAESAYRRVVVALDEQTKSTTELYEVGKGQVAELSVAPLEMSRAESGKVAILDNQGPAILDLASSSVRRFETNDSHAWMKDGVLRQAVWMPSGRLGFMVYLADGSVVWALWQVTTNEIKAYGRGAIAGSWSQASENLALIALEKEEIHLLTPSWDDPLQSKIIQIPLAANEIYW